jgi:N-hydroxyarylamine O-acetyltransferase
VNGAGSASLDLDAYLARIGYRGERTPTAETLSALHQAHAVSITFENLDVILGRPIKLDLKSVERKLVADRRGGYCFEQNSLFAAVLDRLGFRVAPLAARVRFGAEPGSPRPRSHVLLKVDLEGGPWLADVGFGSPSLLRPMRMAPGDVSDQFGCSYRVARDGEFWVLQLFVGGAWADLYAYTLEPQFPIDFEVANYYISTNPRSLFVQAPFVARRTPEAHCLLRGRELTIVRGGDTSVQAIDGNEHLLDVLAEHFNLHFPAGTRFLPQ